MDKSSVQFDKRELFSLWIDTTGQQTDKKHAILTHVLNEGGISQENAKLESERKVGVLCDYFQKLWKMNNRSSQFILTKHSAHFNKPFTLDKEIHGMKRKSGRRTIPFDESDVISKRRKTAPIRKDYDTSELTFATQMKLREDKQIDASKLLQESTQTTPSRAKKIRNTWKKSAESPLSSYTGVEALALIVNNNLSTRQYIELRKGAKSKNANIYPAYGQVLAAKRLCYPADEFINVSETEIDVKLQALLDITSQRILEVNKQKLINFSDEELLNINMVVKYGMDGTTGNAEYNQKFENDDGQKSEGRVFISSLVPIRAETNNKVLFQNERPSSTRLCRPIHIQMAKETPELTFQETKYLEDQIKALHPTEIVCNGRTVRIHYQMLFTMVDGKICSALTETSSPQRCYICKASPLQMNDLKRVKKLRPIKEHYKFGLSTLHAWIRFMEYLLSVAYRLEVKKWAPRGVKRTAMKKRMAEIQQRFKLELGLLVDKPRGKGLGNSNTGNVARRFFQNADKVAEITGLNSTVIRRCGTILQVMACGRKVDTAAFSAYCKETARLCVKLYPWYYLPASVHKVLLHGADIIEHFLIPIGQLSEEAAEAKNKEYKRYRENLTMKISRKRVNLDLLHWLLLSSDPVITSARGWPKKSLNELSKDALSLLVESDTVSSDSDIEED